MNTSMPTIFNNHFSEFVDDIQQVFPEDVDIATAKNSLIALRKTNPVLLIKIWNTYVAEPYRDEIELGNIEFFINNDYSKDLSNTDNSNKIMEYIDKFREPIKLMSADNQAKTMKYIKNLSKISLMHCK